MPHIQCSCGQRIHVEETQAGQLVRCHCGKDLVIPPLSVLRRTSQSQAIPAKPPNVKSNKLDKSNRETTFLLTPEHQLVTRISQEALHDYATACERVVTKWAETLDRQAGFDIQYACALLPNGKTLVDVQTQPESLPLPAVGKVTGELETLPAPLVWEGPAAFVARKMFRGGCDRSPEFTFPFVRYLRREGPLDELLLEAGGVSPSNEESNTGDKSAKPSVWTRFGSLFWKRNQKSKEQRETDEVVGETTRQELVADLLLQETSIVQLRRYIDDSPNDARLLRRLGDLHLERGDPEPAIAAYTEAIRLEPTDARGYHSRGAANCMAGNSQQGLADYTTSIELNPQDAACFANRGRVFLAIGAWARAETDFSAAIDQDERQPGFFVDRARSRYAQQNFARGLEDLQTTLKLDPHHELAYALRGLARQEAPDATIQDAEAAVADFSRALEIAPDNPFHYVHRAQCYAGHGKFNLAIDDCNRTIELDARNAMAYGVRGYANQQLNNYDAAVSDCSEAIELGLESPAVYISRAIGYHLQDENELAMADCEVALTIDPDSAIAFNLRGILRLAQGEVESAMEDFEAASHLAPEWATPYGHRANAHRLLEDHELAIKDYTRTIQLEPSNPSAYLNRALTWMDLQEYDKALDDLVEALRIDSEFSAGYYHRAELLLRRDELDRALTDLDKAISLEPDFAAAYFTRAQVLQRRGKSEEALRDYNRLIQLDPSVPAGYIGRANAWIQLGDHERASEDYREAVHLDPGSAENLSIHRLLVEAHHLHDNEEYERAISKATEAIDCEPECAPAYAIRSASYWYSEQWVEAVDDFTRLLEMMSDASYVYGGRGQVYAEMGEYEAALSDLDKAVEMQREAVSKIGLAYALNGRGLAHVGLQQFEEAERDFRESIDLCPGNSWVHYNRAMMLRIQGRSADAAESFQRALDSHDPPLSKRKRQRATAFLAGN